MIENDEQVRAAQRDLEYWRTAMTTGGSWLGNENARGEILRLRQQIDAYRRARQPGEHVSPAVPMTDAAAEAEADAESAR
jgi:hypothetical protein